MADIILLQPKCGVWDVMGVRTPTGMLSIAAVPVSDGYDVVLIDQRIRFDWKDEVKKHIALGAKVVCLTTMVGEQILNMMEASEFVKSVSKDVIVVLGGSWAQIEPEMCLQDKNIDVVCSGEGDYLLSDLMKYSKGEIGLDEIKGIVYRTSSGAVKHTRSRPPIKNLDTLPPIPYHLIDLKDYAAVGFRPEKPSMALITSRGCQFRCTFCSIVTLSKGTDEHDQPVSNLWRGYSVERLIKDLMYLDDTYHIKDFYFNDDLISGSNQRLIEFIDALAQANEQGRDWNWGTAGIRADHILRLPDSSIEKLMKSGCKNLDIGVESGNPRMLKVIKKDTTQEVIRKANQRLNKYPIILKYTFMGGFPTETEEEFLDTLRFRKILQDENEFATCPIFFYTPFPGTEMFSLAIAEGFRPPKSLKDWADFNYNTWYHKYPCWLSKRKIRLVENAVFLSYFSNKKLLYKFPNPLMRSLFKIYYPLAKMRYDHNYYGFMVEKYGADFLGYLNNKLNIFNRIQKRKKTSAV